MFKFVLLLALVGILLFYITRKLYNFTFSTNKDIKHLGFVPIQAAVSDVDSLIKRTGVSVVTGFVLLLIVIVLGIKIKILFILIPIAIYLIAQLFLLANHININKNQKIWFSPSTLMVLVEEKGQNPYRFHLLNDVSGVKAVRAVQHNRGVLFGYYQLTIHDQSINIPFLLEESSKNTTFFRTIKENHTVQVKSILYPIIKR